MTRKSSLTSTVAKICASISDVEKRGRNSKYDYLRAPDITAVFRKKLFRAGILLLADEYPAEFVQIGVNLDAAHVWEARVSIAYRLTDGKETIGPDKHNGVGRDDQDKGLYKAKTGALKYYLKQLGLIPAEADDPEYESEHQAESPAAAPPRKIPASRKPVADFQVAEFQRASAESAKTPEEIERMLSLNFKVKRIEELPRRHFPTAIRWAMAGSQPAPKLQAVAVQKPMPFPPAANQTEKKAQASSTKFEIEDSKGSYAL